MPALWEAILLKYHYNLLIMGFTVKVSIQSKGLWNVTTKNTVIINRSSVSEINLINLNNLA